MLVSVEQSDLAERLLFENCGALFGDASMKKPPAMQTFVCCSEDGHF